MLAEVGLRRIVVPAAAADEVRRNVGKKLSEALAAFEPFLDVPFVEVVSVNGAALRAARSLAHAKDVPTLAAARAGEGGARVDVEVRRSALRFDPSA